MVKSVKFKNHRYIGDPINAVKIFNDLKADELAFLDITASREKRIISLDFVRRVGDEANMPFTVGGGIRSLKDIKSILNAGAEKVILNTFALERPEFIKEAADTFGSSTIVVCLDVKKNFFSNEKLWTYGADKNTGADPVSFAQLMQEMGAGEIIIQSVENDGIMEGYDISLIRSVSNAVNIPVVALGGAGNFLHLKEAIHEGRASAAAAGSIFVYHGPRNAVLINYPSLEDLAGLIV